MKKTLIFSLLLISLILTGCMGNLFLKDLTINDNVLRVKVVKSEKAMIKGLSGKKLLPEDQGMLFVYQDYALRNFHMKDMNFPIDIIWLKDNQIVGIEHEVPILVGNVVTKIASREEVNMVLEVNSKWTQTHNLKIGDIISLD